MLNEEKIFQQDVVAALEKRNELLEQQNQILMQIVEQLKWLK